MDVLGNPAPPARCRPQKLLNEANAMARKAEADLASAKTRQTAAAIVIEQAQKIIDGAEKKAKPKAKAKSKKE
jgi:hypothetical protein